MFPDEVLPIGTQGCCSLHTLLVGRRERWGRVVLLIEVIVHQPHTGVSNCRGVVMRRALPCVHPEAKV